MPTFPSLEAYNRALADLQRDIDREGRKNTTQAQAKVYGKAIEQTVAGKIGGDLKLGKFPPAFATQVKDGSDETSIVAPTKGGAGVSTIIFRGRNLGETGAMQGPGIMRSGRTSKRIKAGGAVRARKGKRWNGYTYPNTYVRETPDDVLDRLGDEFDRIAGRELRKTTQKRLDVD